MEKEIKKYTQLNELAEENGIVVFGSGEDVNIPLGEIAQAFSVDSKMYNRSFKNLSVKDAKSVYEKCVTPLCPETVLVHIGESDKELFSKNPSEFDAAYRSLITFIKSENKNCRVAIVCLRNYENDKITDEMNRHLKSIADFERCEYGDITSKKVWNPKATKDAASFVYSVGFIKPLKYKRPLYDLVRMLFCFDYGY